MTKVITKMEDAARKNLREDALAVLETLNAFGALLLEETSALQHSDFGKVDDLQPAKRELARKYHGLVSALAAHKDEMASLELPLREKLVKARTQFTLALNDNMRALENMKDSTKRLVNRILEEARRSVTEMQQTNYSARGQTQAYKTSTLSLSVDQKL